MKTIVRKDALKFKIKKRVVVKISLIINYYSNFLNFFLLFTNKIISFKILCENLNLAPQHCCHQCCGSRRLRIQAKKDLVPIVVELFHFGPAPASRDGGSSSSPVVHNLLLKKSLEKFHLSIYRLALFTEMNECFALLFQ